DAFTICDGYHCSVFGPTNPNRLMSLTATIDPDGTAGGPVCDNSSATGSLSWTTYPEQLQNKGISWMLYDEGNMDTVLQLFAQYQSQTSPLYQKGNTTVPPGTFEAVAAAGQLPQVSWVLGPLGTDEHPSSPPALGEDFVSRVLTALTSNATAWSKTALFLTYDENDGFFDHVVPPTAQPGTPGEYLTVSTLPSPAGGIRGPVGLGYRVPMMVISPFSRGGWVCSDTFDHTSTLRFLETNFGAEVPNLSALRRANTGDLTSAFNWNVDTSVPSLPQTAPLILSAGEACGANPAPTVPSQQSPPQQEASPVRQRVGAQPSENVPDLPWVPGAVGAAAVAALLRLRTRNPAA
ncbi:MAG: phospholipase, partial [Candidatus Dormibacteraeota bacterium]|nr:phospholipase [Candidatus Dormibacteraeota bacterium]